MHTSFPKNSSSALLRFLPVELDNGPPCDGVLLVTRLAMPSFACYYMYPAFTRPSYTYLVKSSSFYIRSLLSLLEVSLANSQLGWKSAMVGSNSAKKRIGSIPGSVSLRRNYVYNSPANLYAKAWDLPSLMSALDIVNSCFLTSSC